jgi:type II secretory pathway pseudopilin PulG
MKTCRGISILECIVACAVVSAFSVVSISLVTTAERNYRVTTAAHQLLAEIQAARLLAVSRNATMQVVLNDDGSYEVVDPGDVANPPRHSKVLPPGVVFEQTPGEPFVFFPRGNARSGTIRVGNGALSRSIVVKASGQITIL